MCAGSILAACEALAGLGHARPSARARAMEGLEVVLERGFTPGGECDEGVGYWIYGMGVATLGWSRLGRAELEARFDLERLAAVGDYPRRAHLWDEADSDAQGATFYSANDAALRARLLFSTQRFLAAAAGNAWMEGRTSGQITPPLDPQLMVFGELLRHLQAHNWRGPARAAPENNAPDAQLLADQGAAIFRADTPRSELLATLAGGHNAERHNHNDLGHFNLALNQSWIVPDLGSAPYSADFFGPNRYDYLHASSRGHCCPLVNGHEQRAGREAAAKIVHWSRDGSSFKLDLTAAYPPAAGLQSWTRELRVDNDVALCDEFRLAPNGVITHVLWSCHEPRDLREEDGSLSFDVGELRCELRPAPRSFEVTSHSSADLKLLQFDGQTLFCLRAHYKCGPAGVLRIETRFTIEN